MWGRLLRRCHPDHGGDASLFVWVRALQEYVVGDGIEPAVHHIPRRTTTTHSRRVAPAGAFADGRFDNLTAQALAMAEGLDEPYAALLLLLRDLRDAGDFGGVAFRYQREGATYRSLAAIGYRVGMTDEQRSRFYRIAEAVPLSQRHANWILEKLQEGAA